MPTTQTQVYCIKSSPHSWISSFLGGRSQQVLSDGATSLSASVQSGRVLAPLLFLLFINDLPENISRVSTARLFADAYYTGPQRLNLMPEIFSMTWTDINSGRKIGSWNSIPRNAKFSTSPLNPNQLKWYTLSMAKLYKKWTVPSTWE